MIITPSILNCNFLKLEEEIKSLTNNGINHIHYDVMDNHFVPNLSFGPSILKQIISKFPNLLIDCHMMVKIKKTINIIDYIKPYILKNIVAITFHYESLTKNQFIKLKTFLQKHNIKLGIAINPKTKIHKVKKLLFVAEVLLIMAVQPGFGGQVFQASSLLKIKNAKKINKNLIIQIDGGVNLNNISLIKENKFDWAVVGSFIFKEKIENRAKIIKALYGKK